MNIQSIIVETRALVDATSSSYPIAATTDALFVRINTAMEEIARLIESADGRWQWDDANNTDYPDGVAILGNLVGNTKSYAIDVSLIEVQGVSILNQSGIWRKLLPFDVDDINSSHGWIGLNGFPIIDRAEFLKTAGAPLFYDVYGSYVRLYPAPDNGISVTLTNGLKIYGKRTAQLFTIAEVTTGTKVPGFASPFHSLVAYMAALPYAASYKPERVQFIMAEIARKKQELVAFYSKRDKDERPIMTMKRIRHI